MKEGHGGRKSKQGAAPCAACKLLRRRCAEDCFFAPYFPAEDPHKFAIVHKVFGASNVHKLLQELPEEQRSDAVSSMAYEAKARVRDPVYGCVGTISVLQQQIEALQKQLALAQSEVVFLRVQQSLAADNSPELGNGSPPAVSDHSEPQSVFSLDMMDFQANLGESLWSC